MQVVQTFDQFWVDVNPIELWRLGNATHGRFDHARVPNDVRSYHKLYANGRLLEMVKADGGGLSVFTGPNPAMDGKHWYVVQRKTVIPLGLRITRDHRYDNGLEHYTLAPIEDMPMKLYLMKLVVMGRSALYQRSEKGSHETKRK